MSTHEINDGRMPPAPAAKGGSRVRLVWWVCLGLMLVLGCLVAYQMYANRTRFVADKELLGRLSAQTLAPADNEPLDAKSWTQWRGPRRDGVTTAPDLLTAWPEGGPPVLWRVDGGDGYSSFAVRDGWAYTMLASGGNQAVVALDVATGEQRWRQDCGTSSGGDHGSYGGPR